MQQLWSTDSSIKGQLHLTIVQLFILPITENIPYLSTT